MATVMIASQRVIPEAASQAGFQFRYQNIRSALGSILNNRSILNSQ
jgi:NAD dependent epimerase/dehydratase family enzyme